MNLLVVGCSFLCSVLIKQFLLRLFSTIPPLPRRLINVIRAPMVCRLLLLSSEVRLEELKDEPEGGHLLLSRILRSGSDAQAKEWVAMIKMIDRVLFLVYIIVGISFHI